MSQIRSYRRVFDLERRLYAVDRLRLNPNGVPVRGVVYAMTIALATVALSRVPLVGRPLAATPWLIRDLLLPGALGGLLTLIRIEGRSSHAALGAAVGYARAPRRLTALRSARVRQGRWHPGTMISLPTGSGDRIGRLRYTGPGLVMVAAPHQPLGGGRLTLGRVRHPRSRCRVAVRAATHEDGCTSPRALVLRRRATIVFVPVRERSR